MNSQETKETGFGPGILDWQRVRVPDEVGFLAGAVVDTAFALCPEPETGGLMKLQPESQSIWAGALPVLFQSLDLTGSLGCSKI
jgi:hypothetical protein